MQKIIYRRLLFNCKILMNPQSIKKYLNGDRKYVYKESHVHWSVQCCGKTRLYIWYPRKCLNLSCTYQWARTSGFLVCCKIVDCWVYQWGDITFGACVYKHDNFHCTFKSSLLYYLPCCNSNYCMTSLFSNNVMLLMFFLFFEEPQTFALEITVTAVDNVTIVPNVSTF